MRVLVTGASGFIGGAAVRWLRGRGYDVIPCGRRPERALRQPIKGYVQWDLTSDRPALPDVDALVHCAAHVGDSGDDAPFDAVNVSGLRTVLSNLSTSTRFVHVSSASVYDIEAPTVQVREDAPYGTRHLNAYSRTKIAAERIVLASANPSIILRPHMVYGTGDTHLLPRLLDARRLGWLPAYGDGRNLVSITHVDNLALSIDRALQPESPPGIYNVSDGTSDTVDEILRTLLRRVGVTPRIAYVPRRVAWPAAVFADWLPSALRGRGERKLSRFLVSHMSKEFTMDTSKARSDLGYSPRWSYRDGPLTGGSA